MNQLYSSVRPFPLIVILALFVLIAPTLLAQPQYILDPGGPYGSNTIPFNAAPTGSNRRQSLFTPADFPNAPAGLITKIYYRSGSPVSPVLQNLEIKMGSTIIAGFSTGQFITANMNTVFTAATFTTTSLPGNWIEITLQNPFPYNPQLNFIVDATHGGNTSGFSIQTTAVGVRSLIGNANTINATSVAQLPIFGITIVPNIPCISPPVVGTATSSLPVVCANGSVDLNMSSFTQGVGQSYQWQFSIDSITWTNMVNDTTFNITTSVPSTRWYRCAVTCGSITVPSAPVKVVALSTPIAGGVYTINGNAPTAGNNFNSFNDFSLAVVCGGVTGPVTVNVLNKGSAYAEQVQFGIINGTSATNTITINGNNQTLSFTGGANYATLRFNGTQHVKVKNLIVAGTAMTNCFGIQITGNAQYLEFDSVEVTMNPSASASTTAAFVISGSLTDALAAGSSGKNITLKNSVINGGYYGVTVTGPTTAPFHEGNQIENNTIKNFLLYGIYSTNQNGALFRKNDINRANRSGTLGSFYGLYYSGNATGVMIDGNRIHSSASSSPTSSFLCYPIYLVTANATSANPMVLTNNAIYNLKGLGVTYGIYITAGNYINLFHNTVSIDNALAANTANAQRCLFIAATTGNFQIKNNLFSLIHNGSGTKHIIHLNSNANFTIDNNQYYINGSAGSNLFGFYSANVATFNGWKSLNSGAFDQSGVNANPIFTANLISPTSKAGNNSGANILSTVPVDIFGIARTATPDIGAVEYTPLSCLQPNLSGQSSTASSVSLQWVADSDADSVRIEYGLSGFNQGTGTVVKVTGNSANLTGLAPESCYDFYLTTWCNGTLGNGVSLTTVCTKCAPQAVPIIENFDLSPASNNTNIPGLSDCWSSYRSPNHTGYLYTLTTSTPNSLPNHLRLYSGNTLGDTLALISPPIQGLSQGNKRIKFSGKSNSTGFNQWVIIGTVESPEKMNTMVVLDTITVSTAYSQGIVNIDVANGYNGTHEYIVMMQGIIGSSFQNLFLDDITIENNPFCTPPASLNASAITSTSATINWSGGGGTCFDLEWGPEGFTVATGSGTLVSNITPPYTITGLTPNTRYDVYVRNCCNPLLWTGPLTFKTNCVTALSGTYTVGGTPGPSNFATFDSVINTLTGCGVSGPVTFNLQGGTEYITTAIIGNIPGSSATNTITINGGGYLTDTLYTTSNNAFEFSGTQYMTFQNLTIHGPVSNSLLWLHDNAHHLTWNNCHLIGNTGTTTPLGSVIAASNLITNLSSTGNNAHSITVTNCKIAGGYYGITVYGNSTTQYSSNFTFNNNVFADQYYFGVRLFYAQDVTLEGNTMDGFRNNIAYGYYGVYTSDVMLKRNKIFAPTAAIYMNITNTGISPPTSSEISNNFAGGSTYGIQLISCGKLNIYHNSFRGNTSALHSTTPGSEMNIRNNIFTASSGFAFYNAAIPANFVLDYNIYHTTHPTDFAFNNGAFSSLTAWKTAQSAYNANSLQGDPGFVSNTDFHITGLLPNNAGVNNLSVVDIDGDVRPAPGSATVDIGADEYTPVINDLVASAVVAPMDSTCGDSLMPVSIEVTNAGLLPQSNFTVGAQISGAATATLTQTYSATLGSFQSVIIPLGTVNTAAGGTFTVKVFTNLGNDQNTGNDTIQTTRYYKDILPATIQASADTVCEGANATLSASLPSNNIEWINAQNMVIGTGNTLNLNNITATQTVGARAAKSELLVGALAPFIGQSSVSGSALLPLNSLLITVTEPVTLDSCTIFPTNSGSLTIEVRSLTGTVLHSSTISVAQPSAPNQPVRVAMGSIILQPGSYQLGCAAGATIGGLSSNSTGAIYPYSNTGMRITGNTFSSGAYYYFYRIKYSTSGCPRPVSYYTIYTLPEPVASFIDDAGSGTATVNGFNVNFDASASQQALTYSWNFGDGGTGSGMLTSHNYTANGTYLVTLTVSGDCGSDTFTKSVVITGIGIEESVMGRSLTVYPNPNNGAFVLEFDAGKPQQLHIRILSTIGQVVYSVQEEVSGLHRKEIDLSGEAAGVYIMQIITDQGILSRRIVIRK